MSFVVGDNGVVTQAQKAKIKTEEEEAKEEIEIEVIGCYNDSGEIDLGVLNDRLKKKGGVSFKKKNEKESEFIELKDVEEGEEENQIEELPVTVKYKNVEIEITGEYTGGPQKGKTASQLKPKEDYGQFVDYGLDLNNDNNTKNDWKVFYTDEETGRIFLIAADYVPVDECNTLQTALNSSHLHVDDGETGETYMWEDESGNDDIPDYHCNDNHNLILNNGKAQCSFPEIFMPSGEFCSSSNHYYCSSHVGEDGKKGNINSRCASSLQCTGNWKPFVEKSSKSQYADYAIGGPTLEMWVASWNQKHGTGTEESEKIGKTLYVNGKNDDTNETGYYVGDTASCSSTYYSLSSCGGYNDPLYFPHHESESLELFDVSDDYSGDNNGDVTCYGYWLASPSALSSSRVMYVRYYGDVSYDDYNRSYGVRPVVSLKSEVRLDWQTSGGENGSGYYELVGAE